ncbi:MAG: ABC transporter permease [Oceanococcus sp.]
MNRVGFTTLLRKEIHRFMKVAGQTVTSPVITSVLYLVVFGQVLGGRVEVYSGVSYLAFLIPGLIMMSVIQNSFANTSSSVTQSKIMGNLVFLLLAPLSVFEIFAAFVIAAILRGTMVALCLYAVGWLFVPLPIAQPLYLLTMLFLASGCLAALGMIAGILADKFEHLAAFQNYFILPFSFLSGVFYSIDSLPPLWAKVSHFNPFFYMIDGFRHGFFGVSDAAGGLSLLVVGGFLVLVSGISLALLRTGYKLRP